MLERDPLDADVGEALRPRREDLLLDGELHLVPGRVLVAGEADVDGEPVVLAPEGAVRARQVPVELDLA